jgi:hypothetical protein
MAQRTGIAPKHADLAVFPCAGRAALLAGDARRVLPLFENAGLVEDQHAIGIPQMLDDLEAPLIPHGIRVPSGPAQPILEAIGGGLAADVCHLPAVFTLGLTAQALQIRLRPGAGL